MQWDSSPNAGFSPAGVEMWLPIADDYEQINVAAQQNDSTSMLSLTRDLIRLRQMTPALNIGQHITVENMPDDCFVYVRQLGDERRLIALNFSAMPQTLTAVGIGTGKILLSTHPNRSGEVDLAEFTLAANEGIILEL